MNLGNLISLADDKIAIIETDSGKEYSYLDLEKKSNALASQITSRNISIGLVGENSAKWFICFLAILKSGNIVVPLSNKLPEDTFYQLLKDLNVETIFSDKNFNDIDTILFDELDSLPDIEYKAVNVDLESTAIILHTSGSLGRKKPVRISHKNHLWILNLKSKNKNHLRTLIASPCYHMNGLSILETLILGHGTAILMPVFDEIKFIKNIEKYKVNSITCVPTMMSLVLKQSLLKDIDTSVVKNILMASAPTSRRLYENVKNYFPKADIILGYGLTEVGPGIFGTHPNGIKTPPGSVGYPLHGVDYRLVNGVLEIRSPSMMIGTSNKITKDGYFRTNDVFTVDEKGFYYFQHRSDDMFTCGGNNIYPSNVEEILNSHPNIEQSAVIGIEDEIKGVKPYAFVVTNDKSIDIKSWIVNYVEHYECPRKIWIVDNLPHTDVNKIDKNKLKEIAKVNLQNDRS